jgi:metal-sulfur cluster biosynthetic enzyme
METVEQNAAPVAPDQPAGTVSRDQVWEALSQVMDPELHMNIVSLGLVYGVEIRGGDVDVEITLTSPGCPYGPQLLYAVEQTVRTVDGVKEVSLNVVWEPPWGPDKMSEEARLELGLEI